MADSYQFIIFGATGDLTHRKLIPAFYNLYRQQQLPEKIDIIAIGRRKKDSQLYREEVYASVKKHSRYEVDEESWPEFASKIKYLQFDFRQDEGYRLLKEELQKEAHWIYYLAVAPEYFALIVDKLEKEGLAGKETKNTRVVIEKPFGKNLETARQLNDKINKVFSEENIYRIDHYLGKEMLQNIMVIRFANSLFEPLWNNKHIDNIQIVSSEIGGVGERGAYYDQSGALRDMVQNHMMQLLALTAMEPPVDLETDSIRAEKVKVLKALEMDFQNIDKYVVRGQYGPGQVNGVKVPAYREENRVDNDSGTETFVALKLFVNNLRWSGVPFYIKTGKRLTQKSTEIIVEFKGGAHPVYLAGNKNILPNLLVIRIQPLEGIFLQFNAKRPGTDNFILPVQMDYCQNCQLGENSPEAYERLIHDILKGDATLFTHWDEVEYSWHFIDRIAEAWSREEIAFPNYPAGSNGPLEAERLLERDGRSWWHLEGFHGEHLILKAKGVNNNEI